MNLFSIINDSKPHPFEKRDFNYYTQLKNIRRDSYITLFTISLGIVVISASILSGAMVFKYPKTIKYILGNNSKLILNSNIYSKIIVISSLSFIGIGCFFIGISKAFLIKSFDSKIKNRDRGSYKDIAGDFEIKDFCPFNKWEKIDNVQIKDLTSGRLYRNKDTDCIICSKGLNLLVVSYLQVLTVIINVVYRFFRSITFFSFWKADEREISTKERFKGWGFDVSRILFAPVFFVFAELSLLYLLISPKNGRKLYASYERLNYGESMFAVCFQPLVDEQYYTYGAGWNFCKNKKEKFERKIMRDRCLDILSLENEGKGVLASLQIRGVSIKKYLEFRKEIMQFKILRKEKSGEDFGIYLNKNGITKKDFEKFKEQTSPKIGENNEVYKDQLKNFSVDDIDNYLSFLLTKTKLFLRILLSEKNGKEIKEDLEKNNIRLEAFEIFKNSRAEERSSKRRVKDLSKEEIKELIKIY